MNNKLSSILIMLINVVLITVLATYNTNEVSFNSTSMFGQETTIYVFRNILADILIQTFGYIVYIVPLTLLVWSYKYYIGIKVTNILLRVLSLFYILLSFPACLYFILPYNAGIVGMYINYHIVFLEQIYYLILMLDLLALFFALSISLTGYTIIAQIIVVILIKPITIIKNFYNKIKAKNTPSYDNKQDEIEVDIIPQAPKQITNEDDCFDFMKNSNDDNLIKEDLYEDNEIHHVDENLIKNTNKGNQPQSAKFNDDKHKYFIDNSTFFKHFNNVSDTKNQINSIDNNKQNDSNDSLNKIEKEDQEYNVAIQNNSSKEHVDNIQLTSEQCNTKEAIDTNIIKYDTSIPYRVPSNLINDVKSTKNHISRHEIHLNTKKLEQTMKEFGILGKVVSIKTGPVVTLYEITIPPGIKTSKLISLEIDIALRMKAISVRIAVVPGKDVIGIEIPNKFRSTVYFKEILKSKEFQNNSMKLPLILGHNTNGNPIVADLSVMPHLLIAGTTGSGKSVGINVMILSLLYKYSPDKCKLIMIDPKMLELSVYQDIPHLLTPVVTDPKQAIIALKWAVKEMEQRYYKMSLLGVRNVIGYNEKIKNTQEINSKQKYLLHNRGLNIIFDYMPYIVVIIDEMADLMMVAGKEVELAVQRLAQMARAAGIHVIMATQRPSADVITGTIKTNFPTRIAFQVSSKIDSRIVLESQGAEQLLGKGDMLFMPGVGRLQRVHAPFVSDDEVFNVSSYLKDYSSPKYIDVIKSDKEVYDELSDSDNEIDELYNQAIDIIIKEGKASTSFLQRKFQIGYNRAARIIEHLEENNIISKASPTGKRQILINRE